MFSAHSKNLNTLILGCDNLEELPIELSNNLNLKTLNIGSSKLKKIPKEISNLSKLYQQITARKKGLLLFLPGC